MGALTLPDAAGEILERGKPGIERRVADLMGSYWTNFAKTGDPNGAGLPQWPAWGADRQLMRLTADAAVETEMHRARYELYARVAAAKRAQ